MRNLNLLLLVFAAVACSTREGTLVAVSVDSLTPLSDVVKLRAHAVVGGTKRDFDVPLTTTTFPPSHGFQLDVAGNYRGMLSLHLDAIASTGDTVASADGTATLAPGSVVPLSISFGGGNSDGGSDQSANSDGASGDGATGDLGTIVITPATASLGVGRSMRFTASMSVTWSVVGGDPNGTIDQTGVYTAPLTPGSYTVVATTPGFSGSAAVTVKPLVMEVVGGQLGGPGNVDGVGQGAHFDNPRGIAYDNRGYAYVADTNNSTIRKIAVTAGVVSTLAGSPGQTGLVDDVGPAARFNKPESLAVDPSGTTVWVADTANNAIRQVDVATGTVTTLMQPNDMGPVASGDISYAGGALYFLGQGVQKLTTGTNTVTTISPAANFGGARGIYAHMASSAVDIIYVADGNAIEGVSPTDGTVTLLAGDRTLVGNNDNATGTAARFSQPTRLAVGNQGNFLYISDTQNCTIRQISTVAPYAVTTYGGTVGACAVVDGVGSAARFGQPQAIAFPIPDFQAVIADQLFSIRHIDVNGTVTTIAGTGLHVGNIYGAAGVGLLNFPLSVAYYQGKAYVTSTGTKLPSHTVVSVDLATGEIALVAGTPGSTGHTDDVGMAARFNSPTGITSDGKGNLFVADTKNHTIRQIEIASGNVTTLAGLATMPGYADLTGTAAQFNQPQGVVVDGDALYVADGGNTLIRKVTISTKVVETVAGQLGVGGFADGTGTQATLGFGLFASGMAVDGQHNLYFANYASVRKVAPGGVVTTLAGSMSATDVGLVDGVGNQARFGDAESVVFDGYHKLYITDQIGLRALDLNDNRVTTLLGAVGKTGVKPGLLPTTVNWAMGLDITETGDLLLTDFFENVLLRVRAQ